MLVETVNAFGTPESDIYYKFVNCSIKDNTIFNSDTMIRSLPFSNEGPLSVAFVDSTFKNNSFAQDGYLVMYQGSNGIPYLFFNTTFISNSQSSILLQPQILPSEIEFVDCTFSQNFLL